MSLDTSDSGVFTRFTQIQIKKLKEAFQLIDMDNDDKISKSDLKQIYQDLGKNIDDLILDQMLSNEGGGLTFPAFLLLMSRTIGEMPEDEQVKNALQVFSEENDELNCNVSELKMYLYNSGFTDENELEKVLKHFSFRDLSGEEKFKGRKFMETIGE